MGDQVKFLSKSQFALEQGWSPSYVTKLLKQGRLVLCEKKKLVNVQDTLALLARTVDPNKVATRRHHVNTRVAKYVAPQLAHDSPAGDDAGASTGDPKYWDSKARREGALADLAEIELARKRGQVVDRAGVEKFAFGIARMLRDSLLGLPTQLAPVVASMTNAFDIEILMRNALVQVLNDSKKMTVDDLKRVIETSADA